MKAIFYQNMLTAALLTVAACAADAKSSEKVLVAFKGPNGDQPQGVLVSDAAGNLYGTTTAGGKSNDGTVFELIAPAAGKKVWREKVLVSFNGTNGNLPAAGLILDKAGNLYGTTLEGGASNDGTVFKVAKPASGKSVWTESVLVSFDGTNGQNTQAWSRTRRAIFMARPTSVGRTVTAPFLKRARRLRATVPGPRPFCFRSTEPMASSWPMP